MSATSTERERLLHQGAERLATKREWSGFAGSDTIPGLAERIERMFVLGRTVIVSRHDRDFFRPGRVTAGVAPVVISDAIRSQPVVSRFDKHGGGIGIRLSPGYENVTIGADPAWHLLGDVEDRCLTSGEVSQLVNEPMPRGHCRRFAWSWVQIAGGLDGYRPHQDRLTILSCNEHGYREITDVVPGDLPWGLRHGRDAMVADQIAEALIPAIGGTTERFDAGHNVSPEHASIAAQVLRQVAANLRESREPLTRFETFPVVDGRYL